MPRITEIPVTRMHSYAFKKMVPIFKPPWYVRAALFICKEQHTDYVISPFTTQRTYYKVLFGEVYILRVTDLPPRAFNCRCKSAPIKIK